MSDPILLEPSNGGPVYLLRPGVSAAAPSVMLLHGLSGDERVVWVLESALPPGAMVIAPRGPFALPESGYSWASPDRSGWPDGQAFAPAVEALVELVTRLEGTHGLDRGNLILLGFSQGAALAFAAAGDPRVHPAAVVAASGFLPTGTIQGLGGLPVCWEHGTRDDRVLMTRARRDARRLRQAGADVTLCETDVGHKLGVECLRGLKIWLRQRFPRLSES